jgi:hypothetical protein
MSLSYTTPVSNPNVALTPLTAPPHPPQVLQDTMEGSAKVAMFVNVSPTADSAGESVCSLNFASRVRGVELGAAGQHAAPGGAAAEKKPRPQTAAPARR